MTIDFFVLLSKYNKIRLYTFIEKVKALFNLFNFENQGSLRSHAFGILCKTVDNVVCKMTKTPLSDDRMSELIIKNAFKSADALSNFSKKLTRKSISNWCYLCDEAFYILTQFNTKNKRDTEKIRRTKQEQMKGKSYEFYFKIS